MKYQVLICKKDVAKAARLKRCLDIGATMISENDVADRLQLQVFTTSNLAKAKLVIGQQSFLGGIYFLGIEFDSFESTQNGIDLAKYIKGHDEAAQIIFITTHDKYMSQVFQQKIAAVDYFSENRPDFQKRLNEALEAAIKNIARLSRAQGAIFKFKVGRTIRQIAVNDVYYIATSRYPHKLQLVTNRGAIDFTGQLNSLKVPGLIRVSNSFFVNPMKVVEVLPGKQMIKLENGEKIRYSRSYRGVIKSAFTC